MGESFSSAVLLTMMGFNMRRLSRSRICWLALGIATILGGGIMRIVGSSVPAGVCVTAMGLAPALVLAAQAIGDGRTGLGEALRAAPSGRAVSAFSVVAVWAIIFIAECAIFKLIIVL